MIQSIYQKAYSNTPAATKADSILGEKIREQMEVRRARAGGTLSQEAWSDLVHLGASYGQEQGFESGFKYAMRLICEALCN